MPGYNNLFFRTLAQCCVALLLIAPQPLDCALGGEGKPECRQSEGRINGQTVNWAACDQTCLEGLGLIADGLSKAELEAMFPNINGCVLNNERPCEMVLGNSSHGRCAFQIKKTQMTKKNIFLIQFAWALSLQKCRTNGNVDRFVSWILGEKDGPAASFRIGFPQFFSASSGVNFKPTVCPVLAPWPPTHL
jgi:hypothetical protein